MNSRSLRKLGRLAIIPTALAVSACSGAGAESTSSTDEAWTHTKVVTESKATFDSTMTLLGVSKTSLQVTNGHGVLTPPALVQQLLNVRPSTYEFASAHMTPPWPAPDGTLRADSIAVSGASITLSGDAVVATMTMTGELSYRADAWSVSNVMVHVDPSTVVVRFVPDGLGGLTPADAQADMHYYLHDCGFSGWCSSVGGNPLPELGAVVANAAKSMLVAQKAAMDGAWTQLLSRIANGGLYYGPETWTWSLVPATEKIASAVLAFNAKREEATPVCANGQLVCPPPSDGTR
jgi:hypothetical protein